MGSIDQRIDAILSRLEMLRTQDGAATVFGATEHRYRAEAALSEAALATFEGEHDVPLPESYRRYLLRVGNGGVGPYYGLSRLEPLVRSELPRHHVEIRDADGNTLASAGTGPRELPDVASSLARSFPLTGEWSPSMGPLPVAPGTSPYDGCVHLAEQGCGYFDFLVVRGEAAGQVWSDYTAGDGSIAKCADDFLDWYEAWLDRAQLEWIERNAIGMALWAPRHYGGIDDSLRLLDEALARSPTWANGWRTRGYVAINRERLDDALAAFEQAAVHGRQEPQARLHLDRARVASSRNDWEAVLSEVENGLAQTDLWASTASELRSAKLQALDALGAADAALETLEDMIAKTFFHLDHHFELAYRCLGRGEDERAWSTLEDAITRNIGPDRHQKPATRADVYERFAAWLDEGGDLELAKRVRATA